MTILVTGGAGCIGSNLVRRLVGLGHNVLVADNLWRGSLENLIDSDQSIIDLNKCFFRADLREYKNCLSLAEGVDTVIHLADIVAGINFIFENELDVYRANILINSNMLHAALEARVKRYIYLGTACSYPLEKQNTYAAEPLIEDDAYPANPESAYGWSKLMGEYECGLAQQTGTIETAILRLHNVYGPPCDISPERSQVIPALCRKAINFPQEDFVVWGSGLQRRAFLYVDDVVDAICLTMERGFDKGVIQIGPTESYSIKQIAELIVRISGKSITPTYDHSKPEGDRDRKANNSKARELIGWSPKVPIEDGLEVTYQSVVEQIQTSSR
jgi:GDP-D-mannose 3', 5'-epimerase